MRGMSSHTSDSPIPLQCPRHGHYGDGEHGSHQNSALAVFQLSYNWLFLRYKAINGVRVGGWYFCRPIINNHLPRLAYFYPLT